MHVPQLMLVEADSAEEAVSATQSKLEDYSDTWYDWFDVGSGTLAGRWTGAFFGAENPNDALRYSDDTVLADEQIAQFFAQRQKEFDTLKEELVDKSFDLGSVELIPLEVQAQKEPPLFTPDHMLIWTAQKLLKLASNEWTPDSGLFDVVENTSRLKYFYNRITHNPTQQFLVAVDFHF